MNQFCTPASSLPRVVRVRDSAFPSVLCSCYTLPYTFTFKWCFWPSPTFHMHLGSHIYDDLQLMIYIYASYSERGRARFVGSLGSMNICLILACSYEIWENRYYDG